MLECILNKNNKYAYTYTYVLTKLIHIFIHMKVKIYLRELIKMCCYNICWYPFVTAVTICSVTKFLKHTLEGIINVHSKEQ